MRSTVGIPLLPAQAVAEGQGGGGCQCVRSNNTVANLEWCSQWENLNHSQHLGRMQRDYWIGKRSPSATLTDETAEQIRVEYKKGGVSWESLAKKFGTNKRTVGRIISGESYV